MQTLLHLALNSCRSDLPRQWCGEKWRICAELLEMTVAIIRSIKVRDILYSWPKWVWVVKLFIFSQMWKLFSSRRATYGVSQSRCMRAKELICHALVVLNHFLPFLVCRIRKITHTMDWLRRRGNDWIYQTVAFSSSVILCVSQNLLVFQSRLLRENAPNEMAAASKLVI